MTDQAAGCDLAAIANALSVEEDDERVKATIQAVMLHDARVQAQTEVPASNFMERDAKAIRAISKALSTLGGTGHAYLARYGIHLGDLANKQTAEMFLLAADEIERNSPRPHRGRRPENNRAFLVNELAEIFKNNDARAAVRTNWETGKPYGPFFDYLKAAFASSDDLKELSDHAIAKFVKRTVKDKSRGN